MSNVWSVGVFLESINFDIIKQRPSNVVALFDARKLRSKKKHVHTYADPFVFVYGDMLYLFIEVLEVGGLGYIYCWRSSDVKKWEDVGVVLKESFHVSYPYLFQSDKGDVYMVPESSKAGEVILYKFESFPNGLKKVGTILKGRYADSNILQKDNVYYLFTTNLSTGELELFFTEDFNAEASWKKHPASAITRDSTISRNGGGFFQTSDQLFRIAQDTSRYYGCGIVITEIMQLDKVNYKEQIIIDNYRPSQDYLWQRKGRHHLNITCFKDKTVIVMDGLQQDFLLNKLINASFKLLPK